MNPRVRQRNDLDGELFEVGTGAPHEIGAETDYSVVDDGNRKHRLLGTPVLDDLSRGPEVGPARPIEATWVAVPVPNVVAWREVLVNEVENGLLIRAVRGESSPGSVGSGAAPRGERRDELGIHLDSPEKAASLTILVGEAVSGDRGECSARKHEFWSVHGQNLSPVLSQ